eukprot:4004629-Pyramimonas_sp.AAC.1
MIFDQTWTTRRRFALKQVPTRRQNTERVIAQRLDATDAVVQPLTNWIPVIEQSLPGVQDALAELRVGRAQTGQLGSPPTVYDSAHFTD